jgi:hypothetical protein
VEGADWLRTQLTSFGCAGCGRPFRASNIRILAERDGLFFVDLGCAACGSEAVAVITITVEDDEGTTIEAGDLLPASTDPSDAVPAGTPPVSADDLLAMHEFLGAFDGDFDGLFRRSRPE